MALNSVVPHVLEENFGWWGVESRRSGGRKCCSCSGCRRIVSDHLTILQSRVACSTRLTEALIWVLTGRRILLLAKRNASVPRFCGCEHPCGSVLSACRRVLHHSRWNGVVPIGQSVNAVGQQEALVVESAQPSLLQLHCVNLQGKINENYIIAVRQ